MKSNPMIPYINIKISKTAKRKEQANEEHRKMLARYDEECGAVKTYYIAPEGKLTNAEGDPKVENFTPGSVR